MSKERLKNLKLVKKLAGKYPTIADFNIYTIFGMAANLLKNRKESANGLYIEDADLFFDERKTAWYGGLEKPVISIDGQNFWLIYKNMGLDGLLKKLENISE